MSGLTRTPERCAAHPVAWRLQRRRLTLDHLNRRREDLEIEWELAQFSGEVDEAAYERMTRGLLDLSRRVFDDPPRVSAISRVERAVRACSSVRGARRRGAGRPRAVARASSR